MATTTALGCRRGWCVGKVSQARHCKESCYDTDMGIKQLLVDIERWLIIDILKKIRVCAMLVSLQLWNIIY